MSLGGYKFAGRYCEKGSLTDQQWAKRMHETKVAAFMAANSMANAGWQYDMTGSPDGNIHCLDTVGNNYVTVFKRTNGTNDYTWFALYTLTYFTVNGTNAGSVQIEPVNNKLTSTNAYIGAHACNFFRIGIGAITYNDDLKTVQTDTTGLLVPGNTATTSSNMSGSSSYYPTSGNTSMGASTVYFGFAIKADNIVVFQACETLSNLAVSIASGHAFSSLTNSNDTKGLLAYNLQQQSTSVEYTSRTISGLDSRLCACLNYTGSVLYRSCVMLGIKLAFLYGSEPKFAFESVAITGIENDYWYVKGKGIINIDFLATAIINASYDIFRTLANGNYLLVLKKTGASRTADNGETMITTSNGVFLFVGWDASNPDITQASSWILYDGT